MFGEIFEKLKFFRREFDLPSLSLDLSTPEIDTIRAEFIDLMRGLCFCRRAPQQSFQPREQLDHLKRLGQIIIGAEL